jgi:hypothetical protein
MRSFEEAGLATPRSSSNPSVFRRRLRHCSIGMPEQSIASSPSKLAILPRRTWLQRRLLPHSGYGRGSTLTNPTPDRGCLVSRPMCFDTIGAQNLAEFDVRQSRPSNSRRTTLQRRRRRTSSSRVTPSRSHEPSPNSISPLLKCCSSSPGPASPMRRSRPRWTSP